MRIQSTSGKLEISAEHTQKRHSWAALPRAEGWVPVRARRSAAGRRHGSAPGRASDYLGGGWDAHSLLQNQCQWQAACAADAAWKGIFTHRFSGSIAARGTLLRSESVAVLAQPLAGGDPC